MKEKETHVTIGEMLVYEPNPNLLPVVPTGTRGLVHDLLLVTQYYDDVVVENQEALMPIMFAPGNHDVTLQPVPLLSVGQLGQWQEYYQSLRTKARFVADQLRSLDIVYWACDDIPCNVRKENETESTEPGLLDFCSPSLDPPYALNTYCRSIQDEFYSHIVSVVLKAREFLYKTLNAVQLTIRLAGFVVAVLRAAASSPLIFCSVSWEKRRWFVFHGSRPPRSTVQTVWTRLPEAYSGSALA